MQKLKETIKVAVIDDGIHESMDSVFIRINRSYVEKGRLYQGAAAPVQLLSMGRSVQP